MSLQIIAIAVEVVGWLSAGLILASYLLVSTGRLTGASPVFQWMNVAGAAGFIVNSGWHHALPSAVLNIAWMAIGVFSLVQLRRRQRQQGSQFGHTE